MSEMYSILASHFTRGTQNVPPHPASSVLVPPSGTDMDEEDDGGPQPRSPPFTNMIVPETYDLFSYLKGALLPRMWKRDAETGENVALLGREERSGKNLLLGLPEEEIEEIKSITRIAKKLFREIVEYYHESAITGSFRLSAHQCIIQGPGTRIVEALALLAFVDETIIQPEQALSELSNVSDITDVARWLIEGPLKTAQRAMHLAHFSTYQWGFEEVSLMGTEIDQCQRVFVWKYHKETPEVMKGAINAVWDQLSSVEQWEIEQDPQSVPSNPISLAVFVQPPWVLGLSDMEDLVKCVEIPQLSSTSDVENMSPSHRVWYNILHTCKKLNVGSFIITSYQGWVYGKFATESYTTCNVPDVMMELGFDSASHPTVVPTFERITTTCWSRCAISCVYKYNAQSPSTLQALTYWIAQSMQLRFTDAIQSALPSTDLLRTFNMKINVELPTLFKYTLRSHIDNRSRRNGVKSKQGSHPNRPQDLRVCAFVTPSSYASSSVTTSYKSSYPNYIEKAGPDLKLFRNCSIRFPPSPPKKRYAPYSVPPPRSSKPPP